MEDIIKFASGHFDLLGSTLEENNKMFEEESKKLAASIDRAKQMMLQKFGVNPKPTKRPMRAILDTNNEEEEEEEPPKQLQKARSSQEGILRPSRTAKAKANANLKEPSTTVKLRNDNNVATYIRTERSSIINERRDSLKENNEPRNSKSNVRVKRSESVEIIKVVKTVEIDITRDDDLDKMPPPAMPIVKAKTKKGGKGKLGKSDSAEEPEVPTERFTRSTIKKEKVSLEPVTISTISTMMQETTLSTITTSESSIAAKKGGKKKYPMPILVKMEPEDVPTQVEQKKSENASPLNAVNATFDVPKNAQMNETVTIASAVAPMNETITISKDEKTYESPQNNIHDSLMTEDNDDDEEEMPLAEIKKKNIVEPPPQLPPKKKNEVFNPYVSSPIKQKIQAFEKQAQQAKTPEKYSTMPSSSKYSALRNGTPSKIAMFNSKATPSTMTKTQRTYSTNSTITMPSSSSSSSGKVVKSLKKGTSVSQESLESEGRRVPLSHAQLIEEKKRQREEKQRQAQIAREALDREKREQALRLQMEREEKYQRALKEKEERKLEEKMHKQLKKDQQLKKYYKEKEAKEVKAQPLEPSNSNSNVLNNSLLVNLQKQRLEDMKMMKQREEAKNVYSFDMLNTDDSTDDESHPSNSNKRPPPPVWSLKKNRRPALKMQNSMSHKVLDALFSVQPINVDLREIFPAIDSRKLQRNSSAVWRTPPKKYDV